ncbi:MAG: DUF1573 domain-containing protein [Fimbriimonadaceae bacterium]|nr:DUF1573 domain-containing protein [Fimbriimonadaceae bacterium]
MIGVWILAAVALQPSVGPVPPAGASEALQQTTQSVYEAMAAGDWAKAELVARRLPRKTIRIQYDDGEVPVEWKPAYREAVLKAIERWKSYLPELDIRMEGGDDLRISFTDLIPPAEGGVIPQGAVVFASDDPSEPRVDLVIARYRLDPPQPANPQMVTNEVGFGIGSFLGLARNVRPGGAMGRTDLNLRNGLSLFPQEPILARALIKLGDDLRTAVALKTPLAQPKPQLHADPLRIELPPMLQGDRVPFSFQLSNPGNAPTEVTVTPDCGCFGVRQPGAIPAGGSVLVEGLIDTSQFPGPFHKSIYIYSSDPEYPVRRIEFHGQVRPRYRYYLESEGAYVARRGGETVTVYFWSDSSDPVTLTGVVPQGPGVKARIEPWEGMMADPALGEPNPMPRKGYRIFVTLPEELPIGRSSIGFNVQSPDAYIARLPYTFPVQQGVVALPERIYFGSIKAQPTAAWVILSRPGMPFKVRSVSCDDPAFQVSVSEPGRNGDTRLDVKFSGQGIRGSITATITVALDDPNQPLLKIPITGTVE